MKDWATIAVERLMREQTDSFETEETGMKVQADLKILDGWSATRLR